MNKNRCFTFTFFDYNGEVADCEIENRTFVATKGGVNFSNAVKILWFDSLSVCLTLYPMPHDYVNTDGWTVFLANPHTLQTIQNCPFDVIL